MPGSTSRNDDRCVTGESDRSIQLQPTRSARLAIFRCCKWISTEKKELDTTNGMQLMLPCWSLFNCVPVTRWRPTAQSQRPNRSHHCQLKNKSLACPSTTPYIAPISNPTPSRSTYISAAATAGESAVRSLVSKLIHVKSREQVALRRFLLHKAGVCSGQSW